MIKMTMSADDIFRVLEADLEFVSAHELKAMTSLGGGVYGLNPPMTCKSSSFDALQEVMEVPKTKKLKLSAMEDAGGYSDGQQKVSHITVERNRRKQMNENLSVLRSLMPCFYVKRGDQASIIEGVVDYITELQQILQSLEAKKQRKVYSEVLSPRLVSSPRALSLSPQKPQLSPRPSLPISPRTPQPYMYRLPPPSPSPSTTFITSDSANELVAANSRSSMAEVEVKLVGGNLLLKTCSKRVQGQTTKVIAVLEKLPLEVLQANISIVDEAMVHTFTIKIGVDCQLSAEELAEHIQHTFG
ncbi:unnamed protein product [Lactuca saligna]|uniref:BHLH domain-containing protein n=1 Tax=Lactuca saligna TaxID=75948 RepID=A0AA36ENZ1_LACSI|nr:unnamed protein product [Lactuca saligna]